MNSKLASVDLTPVKEKILPILKKHDVVKAGLFGSIVRGEDGKNSDIDVLIEFKKDSKKSLWDFIRVKIDLEEKIGKKIDLVEYHTIRPEIRERILHEEVRIYGS